MNFPDVIRALGDLVLNVGIEGFVIIVICGALIVNLWRQGRSYSEPSRLSPPPYLPDSAERSAQALERAANSLAELAETADKIERQLQISALQRRQD